MGWWIRQRGWCGEVCRTRTALHNHPRRQIHYPIIPILLSHLAVNSLTLFKWAMLGPYRIIMVPYFTLFNGRRLHPRQASRWILTPCKALRKNLNIVFVLRKISREMWSNWNKEKRNKFMFLLSGVWTREPWVRAEIRCIFRCSGYSKLLLIVQKQLFTLFPLSVK